MPLQSMDGREAADEQEVLVPLQSMDGREAADEQDKIPVLGGGNHSVEALSSINHDTMKGSM